MKRLPHAIPSSWVAASIWLTLSPTLAAQDGLSPALAEPAVVDSDAERLRTLDAQAWASYHEGDFSSALAAWAACLELDPANARIVYNAACCQARLGRPEKAVGLLEGAVMRGFIDFDRLRTDADFESVRTHPRYLALLAGAQDAFARAADHLESAARETLGPRSMVVRDTARRLIWAAQMPQSALDEVRTRIERQLDWQQTRLFTAAPLDVLPGSSAPAQSAWVLVAVPTPQVSDALIASGRVAGAYDHVTRELITREVGPTLRHELTHALHHVDMDRRGQVHPLWIQEGLASLFEFYVWPDDPATLQPVFEDSARLNLVLRLREINALSDWDEFMTQPDADFMSDRTRAKYAEARLIFQFICERGDLARWYREYVASYADDRSGRHATEAVLGMPLSAAQKEFRVWLGGKSRLSDEIHFGKPALGMCVEDQRANDGVMVTHVFRDSAARAAGLRSRDVIVDVNGQPVHTVEEVVHAVSRGALGESFTLRIRRGDEYREFVLSLAPVPEPRPTEADLIETGIKV